MQPSLEKMVGMLPQAMRAVRTTPANEATRCAQYIVGQCYDKISDWKYLVEEITDALRSQKWPIGEVDAEDAKSKVDWFVCMRGEVTRRDREKLLEYFLDGVFSMRPGAAKRS